MGRITIDHAVKRFGDITIINDVSLEIADGEFAVFGGPPVAARPPCCA